MLPSPLALILKFITIYYILSIMQGIPNQRGLSLPGAISIGIGGMVGGGIFAVLGLSVELARGGAPLGFMLAGVVTLLTAYSYTRLSVTFPSQGGTVAFLDRAFRPGILVGGLNLLLWLSYIIMLSLYSYAFGSYGASFFADSNAPLIKHIMISSSVILITVLNSFSADIIGRAETWIVALKILILLFFLGIGIESIRLENIAPPTWSPPLRLVAGGMIIFLAYEGFELIANAAHDIRRPERNLPRAFFYSVIFVIILYVLISTITVSNLSIDKIIASRDYALAEAARPFLGRFGFRLIAVAALLSTSSAINATLYGAARLSYTIAKDGELPAILEKKIWHRPLEGLIITSVLTLLIANVLNLSSISTVGSAGFLIIFAAVNIGNYKLRRQTRSKAWISLFGFFACLGALLAVIWQTLITDPARLLILAALIIFALAAEALYRISSGRKIRLTVAK
jgi:amino acid transporter